MNHAPRATRHALGETGPLGRGWRWALFVTAIVATVVACLFPLVSATYDARLELDAARFPSEIGWVADDGPVPEQAVGIASHSYDQVGNSHVEVVWLLNLDPSVPPPLGLEEWPGPRQAVASPGLLSAPGGQEFVDRFGTLAGTISDAGLVNPNERFLYVGIDPAVRVAAGAYIDGFGVERRYALDEDDGAVLLLDQGFLGDALYQWDRSSVYVTVALFALAPCLVLIGVAVRLGGERRDQYIAWLTVIGASPAMIRRFLARESLLPVALGCLTGLAVVALAMTGTWPVPGTDSVIVGAYLRPAWAWCLVGAVLAAVVIHLAVFVGHRVRPRSGGAAPRAVVGRSRPWLVLVLLAAIAAQSYLYALVYPTNPGLASTISALFAAAVIVLLAPCGGAVLAFFGAVALWVARRASSAVALVTGRELTALPRPALRTGAVVAAAVVVTVQAVLLMAGPTHWEARARAAAAADPRLTAHLSGVPSDDSWLPRAEVGLPQNLALVQVDRTGDGTVEQVRATCAQLERLGSACPAAQSTWGQVLAAQPSAARQALLWAIPAATPIEPVIALTPSEETEGTSPELVIVSTDGRALDDNEVARSLGALVSPGVVVGHPWTADIVGATVDLALARWLLVAGAISGIILLLTAALAMWFETVRVARRMASLTMMITHRRTTDTLGIGLVGVPIGAAAALGILVAAGLATMPTSVAGSEITMPWGYFAALAATALALSVGMGLIAARTIRAYGTRWIPTSENT